MRRVLLLTGTVGAGKSTTGEAVSSALWSRGLPHALIDLDAVRLLRPPPPGDPFAWAMLRTNLASLVRNYAEAGAEVVILAGVVEDAEQARELEAAIGLQIQVIRLTAGAHLLERRLRSRHAAGPGQREWHLARFIELDAVLDRWSAVPSIDTGTAPPDAVAAMVLRLAGID